MNTSATKILQHLTGETEIEKASIESLKNLVAQHPFFPLAQFFLAKKLKADKSEYYLTQLQKSALYFTNPHWLNYQLKIISIPAISSEELEVTIKVEVLHEPFINEQNIGTVETNDTFENDVLIADDFQIPESTIEESNHANEQTKETNDIPDNVEFLAEQKQSEEQIAETFIMETPVLPSIEIDALIDKEIRIEEIDLPDNDFEETKGSKIPETLPSSENSEVKMEDKNPVALDEHEQMFQNIKALLDFTSQEANADTDNAIVPIDPYHTIDYFASQGIHVDLNKNPEDKLGQNLKKFTQWLRHMKKLGPEDAIKTTVEAEEEIKQIADSSNSIKEIVTEAMAQVLEKQGKKEKAIELYNKLSFLYPHKIPYFADQIKKLKGD